MLRKLGVETTWEAPSGEEALELYRIYLPDVVLRDIPACPTWQGNRVRARPRTSFS
eukprot:gene44994-60951_t